jgi:hypothetical protein
MRRSSLLGLILAALVVPWNSFAISLVACDVMKQNFAIMRSFLTVGALCDE